MQLNKLSVNYLACFNYSNVSYYWKPTIAYKKQKINTYIKQEHIWYKNQPLSTIQATATSNCEFLLPALVFMSVHVLGLSENQGTLAFCKSDAVFLNL